MTPRMRTAQGVVDELRRIDPETCISVNFIRGLIAQRKIPVVCAGRKKLVSMDAVLQALCSGVALTKAYGKEPVPQWKTSDRS